MYCLLIVIKCHDVPWCGRNKHANEYVLCGSGLILTMISWSSWSWSQMVQRCSGHCLNLFKTFCESLSTIYAQSYDSSRWESWRWESWGSARRIYEDPRWESKPVTLYYTIHNHTYKHVYNINRYIIIYMCYIYPCSSIFINGRRSINPSVHQGDVLNQPTQLHHQRARRGCALPRYGRGSWQLLGTEWEPMVLLVLVCNRL